MPAVQTAYPLRMDAYIVGQAVDSRYQAQSGVVETAAGIAFGAAVMRGVNDRGIALFAAGAGAFLGIAKLDRGVATVGGGGASADKYPQYKPAAFFTGGAGIAVLSDAAVAVDSIVRFNTATGRYTNAAASGTVLECTGWTFDTTATAAGQLVLIKR